MEHDKVFSEGFRIVKCNLYEKKWHIIPKFSYSDMIFKVDDLGITVKVIYNIFVINAVLV